MRRVGKTTALYYLLDQIDHDNKMFIDLEKIEYRHIFTLNSYKKTQIELELLGIKRNKVKQYLQLLEKTYFILTVSPLFTKY